MRETAGNATGTTAGRGTTAKLARGVVVPLIGLGTSPMAGEEAAGAVARAIGNGYRHIHTAENYGNEEAVGEGIHWSNPPQGRFVEAAEGLTRLAEEGLVRWWGASNFKRAHLRERHAEGLDVPVNQVQIDPEHHLTAAEMAAIDALDTGAPPPLDSDEFGH